MRGMVLTSSEDDELKNALNNVYKQLDNAQEPLGKEFEAALADNLFDLLVYSKGE